MTPKQVFTLRSALEDQIREELPESPGWKQRLAASLATTMRAPPDRAGLLLPLLQSPLTEGMTPLVNKLAGLTHPIVNEGVMPDPWTGQQDDMMVLCTDVHPVHSRDRTAYMRVTLDVLDGTAAGAVLSLAVPVWKVQSWTTTILKGDRSQHKYVYDLAGMTFCGVLSSGSSGIGLLAVYKEPSQAAWNREILQRRLKDCPYGLKDPCSYCEKGRESCHLAYHSEDLRKGYCAVKSCKTWGHVGPYGVCEACVEDGRYPVFKYKRRKSDESRK